MNDERINRALLFAAKHFNSSCKNYGKPVFLHSLRTAQKASELGYGENVIICAILHDLLEDTDCTEKEISDELGNEVSSTVKALTLDDSISDRFERNKASIDASAKEGTDALVLKCLDTADNSSFYHLADENTKDYLRRKLRYLFSVCEQLIPDEPAFKEFKLRIEKMCL